MALIWSKKSTGVPIKITTAHRLPPKSKSKSSNGGGTSSLDTPKNVSVCVLDINITNNCPNIIQHTKSKNTTEWVGTELELLIAGNWTTYRARIVSYFQQLAIITPYCQLELVYENRSEPQRNMTLRHDRRSEQMPPLPREIKHHPSSVNNIIVSQLIERSNCKTIIDFLTKELSCVTRPLAQRIVTECGWDEDDIVNPSDMTSRQLTKLVQVLRTVKMFKAPDGSCLSPLGEYNLNLGIRKVLEPEFVATARDKPSAYEGHPFLVEAAVSLGGKEAKDGLNVVRFANRIPLLFEGGADVCTRVANNKIKWSLYKIDQKRDRIGVFVSIVSTKIPYKGTGKEYIGDDITEISVSVKKAIQSCCQQLRVHLLKRNALRNQKDRRSKLVKYIPDVSRSLYTLLDDMRKRREEHPSGDDPMSSPRKRPRQEQQWQGQRKHVDSVLGLLEKGEITASVIKKRLEEAVDVQNLVEEEEEAKKSHSKEAIPLYIKPIFDCDNADHDIEHPLFTFRPIIYPRISPLSKGSDTTIKKTDADDPWIMQGLY
jgi:DNA topoisomerase-6 subunit B